MSEVQIREATLQDALDVAKGEMTKHERPLMGYMTMSDRSYVGVVDGKIVCVWGVMRQSLLSGCGYLWLLTTEEAEQHKFLLIRWSQRVIENLLQRYTILTGECAISDQRARRWMRLLGATFAGPEGKTIPFQIVGKNG